MLEASFNVANVKLQVSSPYNYRRCAQRYNISELSIHQHSEPVSYKKHTIVALSQSWIEKIHLANKKRWTRTTRSGYHLWRTRCLKPIVKVKSTKTRGFVR